VVDLHAHVHAFPLPLRRVTAEDLLRAMDRHGVAVTAVSSAEAIVCDAETGNAALARDVARHDRLRGYVFANPTSVAEAREQVRRYLGEERFIGVKMYSGAYVGRPLSCREHLEILQTVAEEFPWALVLFHCGENDPANFAGLAEVAGRFPELSFIAGHMGSKLWRQALPVLSERANIVAEISAPVPARTRIEDAVRIMGPERVVFGSDFPLISQGYMLGCVRDAQVGQEEKGMILRRNAEGLLARVEAGRAGR